MILWFMDRFGLPGKYYTTWLTLLTSQGIRPADVRLISLHEMAKRPLLTRYASRKAPTWIPDEGPNLLRVIEALTEKHKPDAIVLAAPESLACLGLHPEHATLHNLRGSVYWRPNGVPHIVMLPMSTWNSMVNQKDIKAANYGFDSAEAMSASIVSIDGELAESTSGGSSQGRGHGTIHVGVPDPSGGIHDRPANGDRPGGDNDSGGIRSGFEGDGDEQVSDDEEDDGAGLGDGDVRENAGDDVPGDVRLSSGVDDNKESIDEEDQNEDHFFYEPVLSPIGRFSLTADVQKLKRILDSGRAAPGPKKPITLRYR